MSDFPETVECNDINEVSMIIGTKFFRKWTDIEISLSLDNLCDTFTFAIPFDSDNTEQREAFKPFAYTPVALYLCGHKILTGNFIRIKPTFKAGSNIIEVDCYSKTGVLGDVTAAPSQWPLTINGLNLKQIAEKLAKLYDIKVIFTDDPGAKFGNVKFAANKLKKDKPKTTTLGLSAESIKILKEIDPGASFSTDSGSRVEGGISSNIYEFLMQLARQRKFIMSTDKDGNLLFKKSTTLGADTTLIQGIHPVIQMSADYNGQKRYSDITVHRHETKKGGGAGQKYTIQDPELTSKGIYRHHTISQNDTEAGNIKNTATNAYGRMLADTVQVDVECEGWYDGNGNLWTDNRRVFIIGKGIMIYDATEFTIRNVRLRKTPEAMTTSLSLILPECFTGEVRTEALWP